MPFHFEISYLVLIIWWAYSNQTIIICGVCVFNRDRELLLEEDILLKCFVYWKLFLNWSVSNGMSIPIWSCQLFCISRSSMEKYRCNETCSNYGIWVRSQAKTIELFTQTKFLTNCCKLLCLYYLWKQKL